MIHVTQHAIDQWIDRIEAVSRAEARAEIEAAEKAVDMAVRFGASLAIFSFHSSRLCCHSRTG